MAELFRSAASMMASMSDERLTEAEEAEIVYLCRGSTWMTPNLVRQAVRAWRPYYERDEQTVSVSDAVEILHSMGALVDVLFDFS